MPDLNGRVAVVTGGTRGIGRAIAESLNGAGAHVVVAARRESDVVETARALESRGPRALGVRCDVRSYDDCRALIARTVDEFGRLDVLVNNAGVGAYAPVAEMTTDTWHAMIETNLNSLFYLSHEAIPHLERAGGDAWIINIGSLAGKHAMPNGAAYSASKFALIGFSEALMQEVRYDGIRVSYIMPGSVATEFGRGGGSGDAWKIQPEDLGGIVLDLLATHPRTLPSRIEVRPARPKKS